MDMYCVSYKCDSSNTSSCVRFTDCEFKKTFVDAIWAYRNHKSLGRPVSIFKLDESDGDYVELKDTILQKISFLCKAHNMSLEEIAGCVEKEM